MTVITSEVGASSPLIRNDGRRFVIGAQDELDRLMAEDMRDLGFEPRGYLWYRTRSL